MKTLLFTLEYHPFKGGVSKYYENLVKYWPEPNEIFVLGNNNNALIRQPADLIWPKWLPALFKLAKEVEEKKISHVLVGQILPLGTVAYFVSKFKKFEYSLIIHGLDFSLASRGLRKRWLAKKILSSAKNIICGNSYTAKLVGDFLGDRKKIIVVNPGVEGCATHSPSEASAKEGNAQRITQIKEEYNLENKFVLLTVGRLVERKGVDMVLKSLLKVLEKNPDLIYVIAGSGPEEENIKNIITELKLEKNVLIIQSPTDEEKNAWYEICDIFIMPARNIEGDFEGFGIVYLEANLAGKPVIAGNSGGVGDAVKNNINGILVDPENSEEITTAISNLIENKNLREKLGEQGRERAIKKFNWEKQVKIIYDSIN